jgi:AcrR family transcriptional regulator
MTPQSAPAGRARPAGRGPKVRAAVLAATLAELTENGYAALTVDNVARRSGVHKTTIYRRWKDREGLVADAVADRATNRMPFPDTGDIDTDLLRLARMTVAFLTSPAGGTITAASMSDAGRIPQVADAKRSFFAALFRQAEPVVSGAIARGELPAGTDPAELVRTLLAPIYLRLLVTAEPIGRTTADNAAKVTLAAARAGALRSDPLP